MRKIKVEPNCIPKTTDTDRKSTIGDRYRLLCSGAALGSGVGPLVVTRSPMSLADAVRGRVAIPGRDTTAFLLLRLAAPDVGEAVEMRYASGRWSPGAVRRGEAVCTKPPGR